MTRHRWLPTAIATHGRHASWRVPWPNGKRFAFTIVDDTDRATLASVRPIYDFLSDIGLLTTKTVWPLRPLGRAIRGGVSLEDRDYAGWIHDMATRGYEIALHGACDESSDRWRVLAGFLQYEHIVGKRPTMHINHVGQRDGIYWGAARFDGLVQTAYRGLQPSQRSYGHDPRSPYFWGDICKQRIRYVRNFVFSDINTLKCDPLMPYHDVRRPYVNRWFSASMGAGGAFSSLISEDNQDRLAEEGGACIVYTHLGLGFAEMPSRWVTLMKRLAAKDGWFVPASTLLDYIGTQRGLTEIPANDRTGLRLLQARWAADRCWSEICSRTFRAIGVRSRC